MNEQTCVVKIRKDELIKKRAFVKSIIEKDLEKFRILGKTPPIKIKDYKEIKKENIPEEIRTHHACTCFSLGRYHFLDKSGEKIPRTSQTFIKDIIIYIHYFPPMNCLEYIAHHEASHIIRHIVFGKYEEDVFRRKDFHDHIFYDIENSLNENKKRIDICNRCPYAHKTILIEIID